VRGGRNSGEFRLGNAGKIRPFKRKLTGTDREPEKKMQGKGC